MARKNLSVITKQTGTPLEIAVISRRLSTPVIVPPTQLTINYLRNLYDVSIVNAVDMQVLQYESGSSYWVNTSPVDAHTYFYTKDQVDALIVDVSGAIIAGNFIKESSLGTDFVWNAGLLDVSIVTMDYAYVNASLNALSNSVAATYATNASVNNALLPYATNASVNLALEAYSTNLSELDDVSIVSLIDKQGILYNSSDAVWKNTDTVDLDDIIYTKAQTDASFAQKYCEFNYETSTYTVSSLDSYNIIEASGTFNIILPNSLNTGFQSTIVNIGNGTITLNASILYSTDSSVALRDRYAAAFVAHKGSGVWYAWGALK